MVKTGFGAIMHKHFEFPMPEMRAWETDTFEKLERAEFDDPRDRRRFFAAGDNQIAGVGDGFQRNSPAWIDTVKSLRPDFPVYGSMIEVSECLTRLIGQVNAMLWMGEYPERMGAVINRIGAFYLEMAKAEMEAGAGLLDGFVIWGDVAYKKCTFMSPDYWRKYFKPWVAQMAELAHAHGLPVIYHGCGNVKAIFPDYIEMGIEAYNPLEAKPAWTCWNCAADTATGSASAATATCRSGKRGDRGAIRREVLRKLNAAKGGGISSNPTTPSAAPSPATPTTTSSNWSANTASTRFNWANSTSRSQVRLRRQSLPNPRTPPWTPSPTPCSASRCTPSARSSPRPVTRRKSRSSGWSWQTYWLTQAAFCWFLLPIARGDAHDSRPVGRAA